MYLMENTECEIRWLEVLNSKKDSISINWRDMILLLFQICHYMGTCHYQCRWTDEASFEFCFGGIEQGFVVAVGSYGCI